MRGKLLFCALAAVLPLAPALAHQSPPPTENSSERLQVSPPIRRAEPPSPSASVADLEQRADELRAEKLYFDALDYYHSALKKEPNSASLYVKAGFAELQLKRYPEAAKDFERAIKLNPQNAVAHNNLGAVHYELRKYDKAIRQYQKAIVLRPEEASYFSNLGAAYFSKKQFEKAVEAYNHALELDPDILERTGRNGIQARMSSPEDRARFDYVVAKLYAKMGASDKSLLYLRRAMEEGYKKIEDVYKDDEFAGLRKDPRFTELMKTKPMPIPE
jgi:tetratricopeptide (TPR) repeat protein